MRWLLIMWIHDTNRGFHIIVEDITDQIVKSSTDLPNSQSKLSLIRYNKHGRAYFNRENTRVYLDELNKEYKV